MMATPRENDYIQQEKCAIKLQIDACSPSATGDRLYLLADTA